MDTSFKEERRKDNQLTHIHTKLQHGFKTQSFVSSSFWKEFRNFIFAG